MIHSTISRSRAALSLAFLFAASLLMKTVHGVFLHHHHAHERHACSAISDKQGSKVHLHDQRFSIEDCQVCDMCFAVADVLPELLMPVLPALPGGQTDIPYASVIVCRAFDQTLLRRPPSA